MELTQCEWFGPNRHSSFRIKCLSQLSAVRPLSLARSKSNHSNVRTFQVRTVLTGWTKGQTVGYKIVREVIRKLSKFSIEESDWECNTGGMLLLRFTATNYVGHEHWPSAHTEEIILGTLYSFYTQSVISQTTANEQPHRKHF